LITQFHLEKYRKGYLIAIPELDHLFLHSPK
jgi:hypothetical protein